MFVTKICCKNLNLYDGGLLEIDFLTEKQVSREEKNNESVHLLFNNVYKLNSLAFVGINASGKTTTLNIVSDIISLFFNNVSLVHADSLARNFTNEVTIEMNVADTKRRVLYKIKSTIKKDSSHKRIYFLDEIIYEKKITSKLNLKTMHEFTSEEVIMNRKDIDETGKFLMEDDSMFSAIIKDHLNSFGSYPDVQLMDNANTNFLIDINEELSRDFIQYLDPSIEYIKIIKNDELNRREITNRKFELKFYGADQVITTSSLNIDDYLSSGTVKGLNVLGQVAEVFQSGGYLFIDEIENHFNKIIVSNIIKLFTQSVNKNGATLLYSTHYSEILDVVDRSDSIYVLSKNPSIMVRKFSHAAQKYDRIDKKKSDVFLSGYVDSAPKYKSYVELRKSLSKFVNQNVDKND